MPTEPPRELTVGPPGAEQHYELEPGLVAPDPDAGPAAVRSSADALGGPVYRHLPGGDVVVPTGRVLVRLAPGNAVHAHGAELAAAGYMIDAVLSYAPHAAWVRAATGRIADALGGLGVLTRMPGIEHVEPQLIGEVSRRV